MKPNLSRTAALRHLAFHRATDRGYGDAEAARIADRVVSVYRRNGHDSAFRALNIVTRDMDNQAAGLTLKIVKLDDYRSKA